MSGRSGSSLSPGGESWSGMSTRRERASAVVLSKEGVLDGVTWRAKVLMRGGQRAATVTQVKSTRGRG